MATTALYPFQVNIKLMDRLFPAVLESSSAASSTVGSPSGKREGENEGLEGAYIGGERQTITTAGSQSLFAFGSEDECYNRSLELESKQQRS